MWIFKKDESIDNGFFLCCLEIVLVFCKCLFDLNKINVFCWIVFESDGFLGIMIDLYDNVVVFQFLSVGGEKYRDKIVWVIIKLMFNVYIYE